jgi:hypothetical protein
VHAQRDLGLAPVAAEVALADEDADEQAFVEVVQMRHQARIVSPSGDT